MIFLFATSALRFVVVPSSVQGVSPRFKYRSSRLTASPLAQRIEVIGVIGIVVNQKIGGTGRLSCTSPHESYKGIAKELHGDFPANVRGTKGR